VIRETNDLFDRADRVISDTMALRLARRHVLQEARIWITPEREVALRRLQSWLYAPVQTMEEQTGS
jgi:hypothetical protein